MQQKQICDFFQRRTAAVMRFRDPGGDLTRDGFVACVLRVLCFISSTYVCEVDSSLAAAITWCIPFVPHDIHTRGQVRSQSLPPTLLPLAQDNGGSQDGGSQRAVDIHRDDCALAGWSSVVTSAS